jgi:hypothetical protein
MADFYYFSTKNHAVKIPIVPKYARGPRAQCGQSSRRSALPLRYGLVAGGRPIDLGD